jgi:NADPH:quinone reductase-like Zn-dependent oxidoreductase
MKAAALREYGGVERLNVEDLPEPKASRNEFIVQVHSAALNHLDVWVRKGRVGQNLKMPHILGSDAAGVVIETGAGTHGVNVGDEVMINPGLSCGCCEYCSRGEQSECLSFGIVGMSRLGTFAEKVAVPFQNVWPKPEHLDFNEAAALPLAYQTAWRMLQARAGLRAGDTVLIHGIGGGVAIACLQLAKLAGAAVIATSSSDEKIEKAKMLGADYGINYKSEKVSEKVKKITNGRGVDIVVDTVGASTLPVDFDVVRRGGRVVLCGVTSGAVCEINLQSLYWNQLTILGSTMGSDEDFRQMLKAVISAKLKPIIDSVYPLENVREAMTRMEQGAQFGKIVLKVC